MNNTLVGLDIGSSMIRAVQVTKDRKGQVQIDKVGEEPLPYGTIVGGKVESPEKLTAALKALWKRAKFTTPFVRLGAGTGVALASTGEVDWAPDSDLYKIIPHTELVRDKWVSDASPDRDYYFDYHPISEYEKRQPAHDDPSEIVTVRKRYVLIAGGKRDLIDLLVKSTLDAKLKPISVDLNGLALIRAYQEVNKFSDDQAVEMSIDIGAQGTTIVMHKHGQALYMRTIADAGGNLMTLKIMDELQTNFDKAELRKFEALYSDFDPTDGAEAPSVFDISEDDYVAHHEDDEATLIIKERIAKVRPQIAQVATQLVTNIRESMEYFFNEEWGTDLSSASGILLSGGVAMMPGFAERLASEFGIPVGISEPLSSNMPEKKFAKLPEPIITTQSTYTVALGLALGEGSNHG